jgi:P27 family predicted phage terminase small subunit
MSGQRRPTAVVIADGKKHLTKSEIKERLDREIQPIADNIVAPSYLSAKQKKEFDKIADQLKKLKIIGETDVDALARYIVANDLYINAVKQLRKSSVKSDPVLFDKWSTIQERYFKQCRSSANDLGLSISSRCKLVVPATSGESKAPTNKFSKFEKGRAVNG